MSRRPKWLGGETPLIGAGVAACAVCCAGPLVAVLTAVGLTATAAAIVVPMLLLVAALAAGGNWWLRRRARSRCTPSRIVDLASPMVRPTQDPA